ncbi:MAG: hypothetical protein ACTS22_02840 [Phycisphaerales bacterium]
MSPRPHISAALSQLRLGVNGCALAVGLACIVQLVVFGFVHFTDVRWETLKPTQINRPVIVTASSGDAPAGLRALAGEGFPEVGVPDPLVQTPAASPADLNRVRSTWGVILEKFSQGATVVGVFAAVSLCAFTILGAIVAGGAAVPGVERTVSACSWGLVIAILTLPWRDIFSSMPFSGVFSSYTAMTAASEANDPGTIVLVLMFIGLPLTALLCVAAAAVKFNAGVERGVLSRPVGPDAIDRDMAESVKHVGSTHQIGAVRDEFRSSFGTGVSKPEAKQDAAPSEGRSRQAAPPRRRREPLNPSEEDDWKRPI